MGGRAACTTPAIVTQPPCGRSRRTRRLPKPTRATSLWLNQLAGIDRQFSSLDQYVYSEDEFDNEMSGLYAGSGLQDLRLARARADSQNLSHTSAVLKIHEAFLFGMAASVWGDLPYSQAGGGATQPESPVDAQEAIYALLMINNGFIARSAHIDNLDPAFADVPIVRERLDDAPVNTVLSNSFGFGGANATLVLQRYNG